jgi:putative FmdB family regulatory protein
MPIYEYQCPKCGTFELTQRITDKPLGKCPTCKAKVKKLISNTSFQLKGTGWYITDYARKGKGGDKAAANGESGAKSAAEAKPDTKTAAKSESTSSGADKTSSSSSASAQ